MSARAFRIALSNLSGLDLTKSFDHLCHGEWTPGLSPPDHIPPGADGTWRSESSGVATGTEGYVKFIIEGSGDTVYVYWDNPFFGITSSRGEVSTQDIEPDCDFQKISGNVFPARESEFEVFLVGEAGGSGGEGEPFSVGFLAEIPIAPVVIFSTIGIQADATILLELARKSISLRTRAMRKGFNLTKGIRNLFPPNSPKALKKLMGFN